MRHTERSTTVDLLIKGPVYRISLAARMSIILSHSKVLLGQNHRIVSLFILIYIFGFCTPKICIDTIQISMVLAQHNLTVE